MRPSASSVFYAIPSILPTFFFVSGGASGEPGAVPLPASYVRILERDPFRPVLPDDGRFGEVPRSADPAAADEAPPPFRLAGIVSVGPVRAASLEPLDGGEAFFLTEGAERLGWRALVVDVASESVDLGRQSGHAVRLTLADGLGREGPEAALRRALVDVPGPELPPTLAEVEASVAGDERELDERVLESLAEEAAAVIEAARPRAADVP